MNVFFFLLLLVPISLRTCAAWGPLHQTSIGRQHFWSRHNAPRFSRCHILRAEQRIVAADDKAKSKPLIALPKQTTLIPTGRKIDIIRNEEDELLSPELLGAGAIAGLIAIAATLSAAKSFEWSSIQAVDMIQGVVRNPSAAMDQVVQIVESMGPLGVVYFGVAYTIAEILAIPAIPLTASAGYLFGPVEGTGVVLLSASVAAAISFVVGRTLLREYVENALKDYPKFAKLDRAIGKEGFKLMLILRLSPIFPFALSNYLYGASSINFAAFFWGTLLGFTPGTIAFVCTGAFGKTLSAGGESSYPWYVYAGGLTVLVSIIKVMADTATRIVDEMENEVDV